MRTAAVFWELRSSPETNNMYYDKLAVCQLIGRIVNTGERLSIKNLLAYGLWDEATRAIMASLQGAAVTCIPLFGERTTPVDLNLKISTEMGLFARDNPGCKIFLVPGDGDYEGVAKSLKENGIPLVLVVAGKDRVSDVLKSLADDVWEWSDFYQAPV